MAGQPEWEDRFVGCLVGLAVGDALGSPLEFKSRQEIVEDYGGPVRDYLAREGTVLVAGHDEIDAESLAPGTPTEDTRLALRQAESLVATGGLVDPADFGPRFITLLDTPWAAHMGRTTRASLIEARATGQYQSGLGGERAAGNGVAMRIAPVGLLHVCGAFSRELFLADCEKAARLTHNNPVAIGAGVALAEAVRVLCRHEIMPEDLMAAALDTLQPGYLGLPLVGNPLRQKLLFAQDYIEERQTLVDNAESNDLPIDFFRIDLNNMERCGTTGYAPYSLAAAFYAFAARKTSFEEAVLVAINAGGDTDTIGAMTGALAGAYHGLAGIPAHWQANLGGFSDLVETARALYRVASAR
jgi:ADP-ribosyl-[dinitrogen reductase] hydrolase